MKLWIIGLAALAGVTLWAQKADCVFCPSWTCLGSGTCGSCVCVNMGGIGGKCMGPQQAELIGGEILP